MAEIVSTALGDRWHTLETYYDHDIVASNGKLNAEGLHTLKNIDNDPGEDGVEGIDCMICATSVFTGTIGSSVREMKGCKCHRAILTAHMSDQKKTEAMIAATGHPFCIWQGAIGIDLAHGLVEKVCTKVMGATSKRLATLLAKSRPNVRQVVTTFLDHSKSRWVSGFREKYEFGSDDPYRVAGLIGTAKGYPLTSCKALGRRIWDSWHGPGVSHAGAHRVTIYLHTTEILVKQLRDFSFNDANLECFHFPELFVFCLEFATAAWVGQYLEGRHRHIALQMSGSTANSHPGLGPITQI